MASEQGNLGAWYLYIVRTSTIAKNRHLNIVLQAELFVRTGTYDRPKLGKNSESSWPETSRSKNPYPWRSTPIHVSPATNAADMGARPDRVGERSLNPLRMKHHLRSGNQKKKTRFAGLFFLTGLRPVLPPSVSGCPASPGHKGQHCQVAEQFYLFIQTPLDNRIRCNC